MKILDKYYRQTFGLCKFLGYLVKLFLTFSSILMCGIVGYIFTRLFKMSTLWTVVITIGFSIITTMYLTWWIKNFWTFIYHNCIKQYIPKNKKKIRYK